jgi:hypothetical protein
LQDFPEHLRLRFFFFTPPLRVRGFLGRAAQAWPIVKD